ncbi:hypothetical protein ACFY4C_07315 [Actinomadura viridis]|uniref:hypothetical protein n=1 Tax=Actinomadura viridis TaxID=58110 RepID=UPI00369CCCE7
MVGVRAGQVVRAAVVAVAGAGMLGGCGGAPGDVVVERSFTDRHGRACTYVLVQDWEYDDEGRAVREVDAENIDCDYPPERPATGGGRP